jgi:aromatic-amino-acid transaminase
MTISRFNPLPSYGGDPILSLMREYQLDPRPYKATLGIGLYFDDDGKLPELDCLRQAAVALPAPGAASPYLPMDGLPELRSAIQSLVFGDKHVALLNQRIVTIQTPGGSGALKVGADFIRRWWPDTEIWLSDPTWDNHAALFHGSGLRVRSYPYYDAETGGLCFEKMIHAFSTMSAGSVVLLHASCHNPTGVDLDRSQWKELIHVIASRGLVPFVDMAYQGFGDGVDEDAWSVRELANAGIDFFVANSFSKNFAIYGERVGGLSVVCATTDAVGRVHGQLQATVRSNYSSPPAHGARLVAHVLNMPELTELWKSELREMRERMWAMRVNLHDALTTHFENSRSFAFLLRQRGMFSYTGLRPEQVERLRDEHAVYLVSSGRICVAGLITRNLQHVARSIISVLETIP